jgi:hypothetical protein
MTYGTNNQTNIINYSGFDSKSLPFMPNNTCFSIGYNDKYGLVDVMGDKSYNYEPYFEGRVNIEKLLEEKIPKDKKETKIEEQIMQAYYNYFDNNSDKSAPKLEVLTYKGKLKHN